MSESICIIGAGSGGSVAAARMSLAGHQVTLFNRSETRLAPYLQQGGIRFTAEGTDHGVVPVHRFTTDIAEAAASSQTILIMLPTSGLEYYADALAPVLGDGHSILLAPGHTGGALLVDKVLRSLRPDLDVPVGETHTLPYICRMTAPGHVTLWRRAARLLASVLPTHTDMDFFGRYADVIENLDIVDSVLTTSLSNHNAVMHSPGMLLNAGWIESAPEAFRYYAEGHSPAVGRVIDAIDAERLEIGRTYGVELDSFLDFFYSAGYTSTEAWQTGRSDVAITQSAPNAEIKAPPSLDHRYIHEDIGFGLVPMIALAELADVQVPAMRSLVALAEVATGFPLQRDGLNSSRLGLDGVELSDFLTRAGARPAGVQRP